VNNRVVLGRVNNRVVDFGFPTMFGGPTLGSQAFSSPTLGG
jgi:hypothetical protein